MDRIDRDDKGVMMPRLDHLRVDHLENPIAIARRSPRFAWQVDASHRATGSAIAQQAYRIRILDVTPGARAASEAGAGSTAGTRTNAGSTAPDSAGTPRAGTPVADTGWVDAADCVAVEVAGFEGTPGSRYRWELGVRLAERDGELQASGTFGIGLDTWDAPWFEPEQEPVLVEGPIALNEAFAAQAAPEPPLNRLHPPRYIRQSFELADAPVSATLRITSQGVNAPSLNGHEAGDALLAPGYESYQHAISVLTHDVTGLLHRGENVLGIILGDGWFAGRISILGRSAQYGRLLRATWRLEVAYADGSTTVIVPDESVRSSRGPIDYSDIFIGERHDARLERPGWNAAGAEAGSTDGTGWASGRLVDVDVPLVPFIGEPIRRVAQLPVAEVLSTPAGETVLDFGQVIAGRVRMSVTGDEGTIVRLEHAEVVDADGNFLDNILGINKDQADEYVLAGRPDGETWEPLFTFHGFRYVKLIDYPGEVLPENFTAVVIANDLEQTASFDSSDARLNRLVENTVWSQRSNFLAVPTDCPQRERAGWTGDLQIFAPTAATLMGVASFLDRWLANLRLDQQAHDGIVPIIVPLPPAMDDPDVDDDGLFGIKDAAGWGDAVTIAPWALYRHYGDIRFLSDNLDAMRAWVDHQTASAANALPPRLADADLTGEQRANHALLWNGPLNFGDWLAPSTLEGADDEFTAMLKAPLLTAELTGPLFQILSLDLLADASAELGDEVAAADLRSRAEAVRSAFTAEYVQADGRIEPDLQGIYVLALAFDVVPAGIRQHLIDRLVQLIHEAGDHLDTGFVSVPYLLDVLWENGHADLARTLLRQNTAPSWLYEVDHGATTIWEAWHAVHEDGTVDRVSMNHYAFGCVVDWMMRRLAGIELVEPGFRASRIAPDLDGFLDSCRAGVDTPYGRLSVDWTRTGADDTAEASITVAVPVGTHAEVVLPDGWRLGDARPDSTDLLEAGIHTLLAARA